ncbi:hypothetical protein TRFO_40968 [Tritrichomonas foetus]|uniref:Uncharacterized protein n=1 Tax=Tritrichomonas foetus TaxID=1144522 RepID=A0A1J4J3I0_9EUKA|nr:hypothetical protein TRFO_40968 [Tritrichomonas foetus]|eukprot:OHS92711.1 hypothetical protein TRFO_40968 [Tritrichomonas foetus]
MIFIALLSLVFDSEHCKRKCQTLFGDSPTKISLCLHTCSNGFYEHENIQYVHRQMKEDVKVCLEKCSENVNSTTKFTRWLKCRKSCLAIPDSEEISFFPPEQCNAECDRHWKGTVHLKPCQDQCSQFTQNSQKQHHYDNNHLNDHEENMPPPKGFNFPENDHIFYG